LLLTALILRSLDSVQAETTAGVVVDGADSTWRASITASATLNTNSQTILPSVVAQYANATLKYKLLMLPASLQAQLDGVVPPVVSDFANAVAYKKLIVIPPNLQTALSTMLPAVETQFANSSYYTTLHYPLALMDDKGAPTVDSWRVQSTSANTALTWNTSEFARCTTSYGTQSGAYTQTIPSTLYYQNHTVLLQNLTPGATYFAQSVCTDQSGNTGTSAEFSFTVVIEQRVWLPLIRR
jgi:hypothetical protein